MLITASWHESNGLNWRGTVSTLPRPSQRLKAQVICVVISSCTCLHISITWESSTWQTQCCGAEIPC